MYSTIPLTHWVTFEKTWHCMYFLGRLAWGQHPYPEKKNPSLQKHLKKKLRMAYAPPAAEGYE